MTDNNIEDIPSHPVFIRADFPFVFIPTTEYTFDNSHTHVFGSDYDQVTTEFQNENEKNDEEEEEEEKGEIIINEIDRKEENGDKNNLRINQSEYSQLLKDLDFSHTRMVDVTNLLSDEIGKSIIVDEKSQNLSSARSSISSNEAVGDQSLSNAAQDIENDLNNLANIIHEATTKISNNNQENIINDTKEKNFLEEDDTSKQATQNYDLNDTDQQNKASSSSPKSDKNAHISTQYSNTPHYDNLSSIPRLNTNTNNRTESHEQTEEYPITWENLVYGADTYNQPPTILIFSQPVNEVHTTPIKQEQQQKSSSLSSSEEKLKQHIDSSSKQNVHQRVHQLSASSDTDSHYEYLLNQSKQKQHTVPEPQLSNDDDFKEFTTHLRQVLMDQDQSYTTPSDILIQRLSNQHNDRISPNKKKSHYRSSTSRHNEHEDNRQSTNNDAWLSMFEKLEHEHKERLEKQQKQYEEYMHNLEEKMKQRLDEYLTSTNSLQESRSEVLNNSIHSNHTYDSAPPIDSNTERYRTYSYTNHYRPLAKELNKNLYSTNTLDKRQSTGINLSRSQSREDISNLRTELSAKHTKHISDLKLYYEHEIDELKNELNQTKMGHKNSINRQSLETIERINNENFQLNDEMKELRHLLKKNEQENNSLKRQLEDLREQINNKDFELKNSHRIINELEQQLSEAHHTKERQDEKFRHADRQALMYREENEKITNELNRTRERLLRLEERYRELENEKKTLRQQVLTNENNNNNNQRLIDDRKFHSTMALNMPTSREYGRFTLTTSKYSSSTVNTSRDVTHESGRYISSDDYFHHDNSPRSLNKTNDYMNEKSYLPPSRPLYSPRRSSPNLNRTDHMPVKDSVNHQIKQSEQLETKFDELLRKKRDLESRINRIPTRGLTCADRQLLDTLEREIEHVEQQISSVKLELRKMNILRTY